MIINSGYGIKLETKTFTITKDQHEFLKKTAKEYKISASDLIRQLIDNFKKEYKPNV